MDDFKMVSVLHSIMAMRLNAALGPDPNQIRVIYMGRAL